jgi:hypothetical protein
MIATVFCIVKLRRDSGEEFTPQYVARGRGKRRHVDDQESCGTIKKRLPSRPGEHGSQ